MTKAKNVSTHISKGTKEISSEKALKALFSEVHSISYCENKVNELLHGSFIYEGEKIKGNDLAKLIISDWTYKTKFDHKTFVAIMEANKLTLNGKIAEYKNVNVTYNDNVVYTDEKCSKALKIFTLVGIEKWSIDKVLKCLKNMLKVSKDIKKASESVKVARNLTTLYMSSEDKTTKYTNVTYKLSGTNISDLKGETSTITFTTTKKEILSDTTLSLLKVNQMKENKKQANKQANKKKRENKKQVNKPVVPVKTENVAPVANV